jgi:DNA end-binding protein Ku
MAHAKSTRAPARSKTASHAKRRKAEPAAEPSEPREGKPRRALWSGTLGFGLLQIPVSVYPLEVAHELSFNQLDSRDMQPVGYRRYNKTTGEEVPYDVIVRGFEMHDGEYVIVTDQELKAANVEATQSIDILDFVDPGEIPLAYFETPYVLAPARRGEKAYALLRDALAERGKAAIGMVVLRTRQHLAAVIPEGDALVLELLRYPHELRVPDVATHMPAGTKVSDREREMAAELVDRMSSAWDPSKYKDSYRDDVMAMIEEKSKSGASVSVAMPKHEAPPVSDGDLVSLLRKSLESSAPTGRKKAS